MTDRYSPYPPDEPVIGANYPPSTAVSTFAPDDGYIGADLVPAEDEAYAADDEWDGEYEEEPDDDEWEEEGFRPYHEDAPARQPIFYLFIALAAIVGGIMVFLLFSLVNRDGASTPASGSVKFNVRIDSPTKDKRIEIGKPEDVIVQATSTEAIVRFDLYIQDKLADTFDVREASADNKYRATLKAEFARKGEYTMFVRVTSASNATDDSDKVRVIAIEPVGDRPQSINGKVVATVNLRTGPGENFDQVGTLTEGRVVKIIGRTTNNEWVLVEVDGGRWVKATALEPQDSLALVPIRQVTPTPQPATNTPVQPSATASPSASASPTANAKLPDLAPTGATVAGGGKLRITVSNLSPNAYTGALTVAVSGVAPGTLTFAFNVNIPANGSTSLDFDAEVTSPKTAQVKVDPDNAVKETNKDNNTQSFSLTPAVEQPRLTIAGGVTPAGATVSVRIVNQGGAMPSSAVTVKITVGENASDQTKTISLAKGQDATFDVGKPGSGPGKVEVLINGVVVESAQTNLP